MIQKSKKSSWENKEIDKKSHVVYIPPDVTVLSDEHLADLNNRVLKELVKGFKVRKKK